MKIIGLEPAEEMDDAVHTIDIWYSDKQRCWFVQRLNAQGGGVGTSHRCRSRSEANACLADWMRRHPETYLTTPHDGSAGRLRRRTAATLTP